MEIFWHPSPLFKSCTHPWRECFEQREARMSGYLIYSVTLLFQRHFPHLLIIFPSPSPPSGLAVPLPLLQLPGVLPFSAPLVDDRKYFLTASATQDCVWVHKDPELQPIMLPALSKLSKSLDPKKVVTGQRSPTAQAGEKLHWIVNALNSSGSDPCCLVRLQESYLVRQSTEITTLIVKITAKFLKVRSSRWEAKQFWIQPS